MAVNGEKLTVQVMYMSDSNGGIKYNLQSLTYSEIKTNII